MTSWPLVSAIVANWNGARDLTVCLPSVLAQDYPALEVIVVDNGSTDDSRRVVKEIGARWLALGRNVGLAGALNAGVEVAAGELLLFLNNDLRLAPDFVRNLVLPLARDAGLFAADGLQWDWEGHTRVHGRTRLVPARYGMGMPQILQDYPPKTTVTFMASAANALVRRWMFQVLGGWDDAYFIGWEDVDLFWRAWQRGWGTVFVPTAVCWHRVGGSAATTQGARIRLGGSLEGRLYFATKCLPARCAIAVWGETCGGLLRDILTCHWAKAQQKVTAVKKAFRLLSRALELRRGLYSNGQRPEAIFLVLTSSSRELPANHALRE